VNSSDDYPGHFVFLVEATTGWASGCDVDKRNVHRSLVETLRKQKRSWQNNIKIGLKEVGCDDRFG